MLKKVILASIFLLCFGFSLAWAQQDKEKKDDPKKLEYDITVTANRLQTPEQETASSLTVITREELQAAGIHTVVEALRESAGLYVIQNGPPGSAASVFIRGADSAQTKVMLDGVELNDPATPSRSYDFSHLLVENIDRIEIIRGPQSPLYGSDAMAGAVNIISRKTREGTRYSLSGQGGSYGTASGNIGVSGGGETVRYSLGAAVYRTDGFSSAGEQYTGNREKDGYRNFTLSGKLNIQLHENWEWILNGRSMQTRSDLDNRGGAFGDDPNHEAENDTYVLHTALRGLLAASRWESRLDLSYVDISRKYDNPADDAHPFSSEDSEYLSDMMKLSWQNNIFLHSAHTLSVGLEYLRERGQSAYTSRSAWGESVSVFPQSTADNTGIFIQDRITAGGRFFLSAGGRWDHHSRAGGALTWRAAPSYWIKETGTRLKATIGTGFKAPSLYQLFAPSTFWGPVGNETLEPERSLGWDAGFEQELFGRSFIFGAACFSNRFQNLIDFNFTQGYINVGKAFSRGVELMLESQPLDFLSFHAAYTFQKAENETTGEVLLRRPQHKFTLESSGAWENGLQIRILLLYAGERKDVFYSGFTPSRVTLEDYILLNSSLSYELFSGIRLSLRLDNILNQEYELVKGYGTPGFSLYAGMEAEF